MERGHCLPCKFQKRKILPIQNGNHLSTRVYFELVHLSQVQKAATVRQILDELQNQDDWFTSNLKIVEGACDWLVREKFARKIGGVVARYRAITLCGCQPDEYKYKVRKSKRIEAKTLKKGDS